MLTIMKTSISNPFMPSSYDSAIRFYEYYSKLVDTTWFLFVLLSIWLFSHPIWLYRAKSIRI